MEENSIKETNNDKRQGSFFIKDSPLPKNEIESENEDKIIMPEDPLAAAPS
jgi:hypothetical protein